MVVALKYQTRSKAVLVRKSFSLRDYVASLFVETGDADEVATILARRSEHHDELRRELILLGARQAVRTHFSAGRRGVSDSLVEVEPRREKEERSGQTLEERQVRYIAKENRRLFWDTYALYGHKLLRDATAKDLRDSIINRKAQVEGGLKAIRFEQALLEKMKLAPKDKTCSEFFTPRKIDELRVGVYGK